MALDDDCAACGGLDAGKACGKRCLIAAAQEKDRKVRILKHDRKCFIDDTAVGELRGAETAAPTLNGLDDAAACSRQAACKPQRETVGGHGPGPRNIGTIGDENVGCPHRHVAPSEDCVQSLFGVAYYEAW